MSNSLHAYIRLEYRYSSVPTQKQENADLPAVESLIQVTAKFSLVDRRRGTLRS